MRKSITINKKEFDINADYNKSLSIFKLKHNSTNNMSNVMNDTLINSNINDGIILYSSLLYLMEIIIPW